ncbi:AraC family transcriptional regulator [Paenibacillus sp. 32O-W]|uniref:AraC family transcriptional regulator n=1 Tax=Paenibacillus sp. 32O-W TaxID=1695218 RepID=UPI0007215F52|nr:AraC family transcriptional regulator [Paenibacillus sp. 32O-W]ALS26276.1 AraC family transcriptional regulator [Paenibacillus sp. 32O-W]
MTRHRRMVYPSSYDQPLPIKVETIGYNHDQETVSRPQGYPLFHWLQTVKGEGRIVIGGRRESLPENSGILLFPNEEHAYARTAERWETMYLTFGGEAASEIVNSLEMTNSAIYYWEAGTEFAQMLPDTLAQLEREEDRFGLNASAKAYHFLIMLRKYGRQHKSSGISRNLDRLSPLTDWLERHYGNPGIGLAEMAECLGVSVRMLNMLFRETYGITPYNYLLHLRIRKGKELLTGNRKLTVKSVAGLTGFRDASHFIATFRRIVGMSPERFRKLF